MIRFNHIDPLNDPTIFDEPLEEVWDNIFLHHQYVHVQQEEEKYALLFV